MKKKALVFALLILIVPCFALAAGSDERGKEIYNKRCWWCHGEDGAGDGPAADFLNPPPRDFTSGDYKWKSTPFDEMVPADEDFAKMIKGGRSHNSITGWTGMNDTSMPGWADMLTDQEVSDLTALIKKFAELEKPEKASISYAGQIQSSKESTERGKDIFKDKCTECHGEEGRGDGTKKLKDDYGFRTWPRNLTKAWSFRVSNDPKEIYTRITVGIPGTQMPSFANPASDKKLTDKQRWDVANYVSSLDAPYKKPGDNTVINAARVQEDIPSSPESPVWEKAEYKSYYLIPQLIAEERYFATPLDSISVKAVYNEKELALLLEWDDRTKSLPGDAKSMEIADGEVFEDSVAVQWPVIIPAGGDKPYFGMGDAALPVNIWQWKSESSESSPQDVKLINSKGIKEHELRDAKAAGLSSVGVYNKGTWRVVMKRPLHTGSEDDIQFEEGQFIPVAFAAWDGSSREKGSKHELTTWYWLLMQPETGSSVYVWPLIIAFLVVGAEILWLKTARKK